MSNGRRHSALQPGRAARSSQWAISIGALGDTASCSVFICTIKMITSPRFGNISLEGGGKIINVWDKSGIWSIVPYARTNISMAATLSLMDG
ncbi:hypothetical protein BDQ12DRAFT_116625 [Crucibulum laeve]|uniref:Uncharacterized protein n=1 Tax=Crucibulum laeve TaxID=68775 RepID=A0A5C3M031_9AGAR|nr:hypothetical protein BDQ12DRAFT_116625 [Crucibulum laeve]